MRWHRFVAWIVVVLALAASACGSQPDEPASAAEVPTAVGDEPTSTPADEPADPPEAASAALVETPTPTAAPLGDGPIPPTFGELEEMAFDGDVAEVDVAVTAFAVVFGDIDGALDVTLDDTVPHEATSVLEQLQVLDSELTEAQRARVAEVLAEITEDAVLVYSSSDDPLDFEPSDAVPTDGDESIFVAGPPHGGLSNAEAASIAREAESYLMSKLGGTRPSFSLSLIAPEDREERQRRWDGWASTREDGAGARHCTVVITNNLTYSLRSLRGTILHELFHCWHGQNNGAPLQHYWTTRKWIKEGLATWTAEEFIGGSPKGRIRADNWLNAPIGKLYAAAYDAVGFYWQVNDLDGTPEALWVRIPTIVRQVGSSNGFEAATVGLSVDQLIELASSGTRIEAWGTAWDFDGRALGDGFRDIRPVVAAGPTFEIAREGNQNVPELAFEFGDTDSWVVDVTRTGLTIAGWSDGPTFDRSTVAHSAQWCVQGDCLCDDGRNLFPDAQPIPGGEPKLIVALTGIPGLDATVTTKPQNVDDACFLSEDVPAPDIAGVWVAEPEALVAAYGRAYAGIDVGVIGASGSMTMTLHSDFRAEVFYDDVTLSLDSPWVDDVIVSGGGKLQWRVEGGQFEFFGWSEVSLEVLAPSVSPEPIRVTTDDIAGLTGTTTFDYVRDGSTLKLTNIRGSLAASDAGAVGTLVFPEAWFRVGDAPG